MQKLAISCPESGNFVCITFRKMFENAFNSVDEKSDFVSFLELMRCSKLKQIAKRKASHLKSMFYRDAQTLVITTLRGTCIHGNIVINTIWASR